AADVDDVPHTCLGFQCCDEPGYSVRHIVEVACRMHGAELDPPLAGGELCDDRWNYGASRLATPSGIERSQHNHRSAERLVERERDLIRPDFSRCVGRLPLQWMILCYRYDLSRTVYLTRRCMYHPA